MATDEPKRSYRRQDCPTSGLIEYWHHEQGGNSSDRHPDYETVTRYCCSL